MIIPLASSPFTKDEEQLLANEAAEILLGGEKLTVYNNERLYSGVVLSEKEKADQTVVNGVGEKFFILDPMLRNRLLAEIAPRKKGWRLEGYIFRNLQGENRPIDGKILNAAIDIAQTMCSAKREGKNEYLVRVKEVLVVVDKPRDIGLLLFDPQFTYVKGFRQKSIGEVNAGQVHPFSSDEIDIKVRACAIRLERISVTGMLLK